VPSGRESRQRRVLGRGVPCVRVIRGSWRRMRLMPGSLRLRSRRLSVQRLHLLCRCWGALRRLHMRSRHFRLTTSGRRPNPAGLRVRDLLLLCASICIRRALVRRGRTVGPRAIRLRELSPRPTGRRAGIRREMRRKLLGPIGPRGIALRELALRGGGTARELCRQRLRAVSPRRICMRRPGLHARNVLWRWLLCLSRPMPSR